MLSLWIWVTTISSSINLSLSLSQDTNNHHPTPPRQHPDSTRHQLNTTWPSIHPLTLSRHHQTPPDTIRHPPRHHPDITQTLPRLRNTPYTTSRHNSDTTEPETSLSFATNIHFVFFLFCNNCEKLKIKGIFATSIYSYRNSSCVKKFLFSNVSWLI